MYQRIPVWPAVYRSIRPSYILLITAIALSLPLYGASTVDKVDGTDFSPGNVMLSPQLVVGASPTDGDTPIEVVKPDEKVLVVLSTPKQFEKLSEPAALKVDFPIGRGRPIDTNRQDLSKISVRLATAGLLLVPLDNSLIKLIPHTPAGQTSDRLTESVSQLGSAPVLLAVIGGLYLTGDDYEKDTAKLALSALLNAGIMTQGMKLAVGRARPAITYENGEFEGPVAGKGYTSFPSGHTSAAFAVATVLANRHPKQKWLYYGLAAAVGYSRVRKSAHFPSDVLVGAGLGIYAGNNVLRGGPRFLSIKF